MIISSHQGMGATQSAAIVASAGNIAAGTIPAVLVGAHVLAASSLAVPIIGAAIAGVTLAVAAFLNRNSTYFAQAKATTGIVNEAEILMKQNLEAWRNSDKTISEQRQALNNFDQIWSQVVSACNQPGYGSPGQACVNDRTRGGRWDWYSYYYDPIANDPQVQSDPINSATDLVSNIGSGATDIVSGIGESFTKLLSGSTSGGMSMLPLLLIGGLGLWAVSKLGD